MVPAFEVPSASSRDWLNVGNYAGRREVNLAAGTMKLSVFDVSNIATAADRTNLRPRGQTGGYAGSTVGLPQSGGRGEAGHSTDY